MKLYCSKCGTSGENRRWSSARRKISFSSHSRELDLSSIFGYRMGKRKHEQQQNRRHERWVFNFFLELISLLITACLTDWKCFFDWKISQSHRYVPQQQLLCIRQRIVVVIIAACAMMISLKLSIHKCCKVLTLARHTLAHAWAEICFHLEQPNVVLLCARQSRLSVDSWFSTHSITHLTVFTFLECFKFDHADRCAVRKTIERNRKKSTSFFGCDVRSFAANDERI